MRRSGKFVASGVVLALLAGGLSGCAGIQDDGTRTRTEGTLLGTGAGAGVGAGIGAIFGGGRGAAIGAGIGALVGGVTGYFVGDHIAKKKADYATEEEWLDACIAQARQLNTEAAQYNAQLKKDIAELDKESAKLVADYKANKASRSALQAEAESIEKRRKEVAANIDILENEVNNQKAVAQDARDNNKNAEAKAVEAEIAAMEKKIVEMRDYNNKLASISVRVAV